MMSSFLVFLTAIFMFGLAAAIFLQVLTRYVFHVAFPFLQMIIAFCMSWLTMIGAAIGLKERKHFSINIFSGDGSPKLKKIITVIREGAIFAVIVALCKSGYDFAKIGLTKEEPSTGLPEVYIYAAVLGGSIFMLIYFLRANFMRRERG